MLLFSKVKDIKLLMGETVQQQSNVKKFPLATEKTRAYNTKSTDYSCKHD